MFDGEQEPAAGRPCTHRIRFHTLESRRSCGHLQSGQCRKPVGLVVAAPGRRDRLRSGFRPVDDLAETAPPRAGRRPPPPPAPVPPPTDSPPAPPCLAVSTPPVPAPGPRP